MSFEQFLMSKDGDQFCLARQLLNTDFIKLIAKQERNVALDLLKELGADETQALVVFKAYTEVADKPQVFQHLNRKARKDYGGMGKQAEYEISADGISQKLDKHQQKSLNALQAELFLEWFRAVMVHASKRVPNKEKHAFGNARYRYLYNLFIFQDFLQK